MVGAVGLAALRFARYSWPRLRLGPQGATGALSPCGFESMGWAQKRKTPLVGAYFNLGRGSGTRRPALRAVLMASLRSALKAPLAP